MPNYRNIDTTMGARFVENLGATIGAHRRNSAIEESRAEGGSDQAKIAAAMRRRGLNTDADQLEDRSMRTEQAALTRRLGESQIESNQLSITEKKRKMLGEIGMATLQDPTPDWTRWDKEYEALTGQPVQPDADPAFRQKLVQQMAGVKIETPDPVGFDTVETADGVLRVPKSGDQSKTIRLGPGKPKDPPAGDEDRQQDNFTAAGEIITKDLKNTREVVIDEEGNKSTVFTYDNVEAETKGKELQQIVAELEEKGVKGSARKIAELAKATYNRRHASDPDFKNVGADAATSALDQQKAEAAKAAKTRTPAPPYKGPLRTEGDVTKVSPADQAALDWLTANPKDPNSGDVRKRLKAKGLL